MDIEKLIEQLNARGLSNGSSLGYHCGLYDEAATALSTLQAENSRLRAELEYEREHANAYHEECGQWEAENEKLRAELEKVMRERDAAIKELDEVTSEVDDLADFVDREIHPVIDYNLYLDLRENVDAVSMFQHEDEWRGLHKEE